MHDSHILLYSHNHPLTFKEYTNTNTSVDGDYACILCCILYQHTILLLMIINDDDDDVDDDDTIHLSKDSYNCDM